MRSLKFIVSGQSLEMDPECSFSGIKRGSAGYLNAVFQFDSAWSGVKKIAVFRKLGVVEYVPIINGRCKIPDSVTSYVSFTVQVIGVSADNSQKIPTNKVTVSQEV